MFDVYSEWNDAMGKVVLYDPTTEAVIDANDFLSLYQEKKWSIQIGILLFMQKKVRSSQSDLFYSKYQT